MSPPGCGDNMKPEPYRASSSEPTLSPHPGLMSLRNGALQRGLTQRLEDIQRRRRTLDEQRRTWWVRRTLVYPTAMLALLLFSTLTALLALQNTLQLLVGIKALPISTRVGLWFLFVVYFFIIDRCLVHFFYNKSVKCTWWLTGSELKTNYE